MSFDTQSIQSLRSRLHLRLISLAAGGLLFLSGCGAVNLSQVTLSSFITSCPADIYWDASWSPEGSRIAFGVFQGQSPWSQTIYTVSPYGGQLTQLNSAIADSADGFVWSPDGSDLAIVVNDMSYDDDIYLVNVLDSSERRITHNALPDDQPAWSPDGTSIAFVSMTGPGGLLINVSVAREGGRDEFVHLAGTSDNLVRVANPAWSPDGTVIAFAGRRSGSVSSDIYRVNSDGSNLMQLTVHPANDTEPAWSPDGTQIAFVSDRSGEAEIYVIGARGSGLQQLTSGPPTALGFSDPAWSPDGTRIAFMLEQMGGAEIYVINADGDGLARVSAYSVNSFHYTPAWSPDGTQIAFASHNSGYSEIYVINADGTGLRQLTSNPGHRMCFQWPF